MCSDKTLAGQFWNDSWYFLPNFQTLNNNVIAVWFSRLIRIHDWFQIFQGPDAIHVNVLDTAIIARPHAMHWLYLLLRSVRPNVGGINTAGLSAIDTSLEIQASAALAAGAEAALLAVVAKIVSYQIWMQEISIQCPTWLLIPTGISIDNNAKTETEVEAGDLFREEEVNAKKACQMTRRHVYLFFLLSANLGALDGFVNYWFYIIEPNRG